MRLWALLLAMLMGLGGVARAGGVGVRDIAVPAGRGGALRASVWYPGEADGTPLEMGGNAVFRGTPGLRGAALAAGRFPLVVVAHGGFRAAANTAAWLARALAERGYVVVLTQPPRLPDGSATAQALHELWLRPADFSAALSSVLAQPWLAGRIDADRVGAVGFFLGGYAALELAGARVDAAAFARWCDGGGKGPDCAWLASGGVDPRQADRALLERSNRDARVRAVVAVDPELGGVLSAVSLAGVAVPVRLVNLGGPGQIPARLDAAALAAAIPGASYEAIPSVPPLSSFPECTTRGRMILAESGGESDICEHAGPERAAAHAALASAIAQALQKAWATGG